METLGIDPKVDYAFKRVFGHEANKPILIHLLNAVLGPSLIEPITDIELLNPFNDKETLDDKLSILDIKAKDQLGRQFNVEMQMAGLAIFPPRSIYYLAKLHQQQMKEGHQYHQLCPTICIDFLNSVLFPETSDYYQLFQMRSDKPPYLLFSNHLAICTIELPKFFLRLDQIQSPLEQWCYFLRHAEALNPSNLPNQLQNPEIVRAVEVLRLMTQSEIERERYESRQKALRDYHLNMYVSRQKGLQEGRQEGLQEGRQEGLQEGRQEGRQTGVLLGRIETLQNLLGLPVQTEEQLAVLSMEELQRLASELEQQAKQRIQIKE